MGRSRAPVPAGSLHGQHSPCARSLPAPGASCPQGSWLHIPCCPTPLTAGLASATGTLLRPRRRTGRWPGCVLCVLQTVPPRVRPQLGPPPSPLLLLLPPSRSEHPFVTCSQLHTATGRIHLDAGDQKSDQEKTNPFQQV